MPLISYLALTLVGLLLGIHISGYTAHALGEHDHGGIVWDEIIGYLIAMIAIPFTIHWMVAGFLLFRFFDIVKPWPIRWIDQKLSGGLGIMLDDVLAGIFALVVLHLLVQLL